MTSMKQIHFKPFKPISSTLCGLKIWVAKGPLGDLFNINL